MSPAELKVKIYYEDTDAGGVVYHANYLRYMERARGEWLSALGFTHRRLVDDDSVAFVVRTLDVSYRVPAGLDDVLVVRTTPLRLGPARIVFLQEIAFEGSNALSVTADVEIACIQTQNHRPSRIPSRLAAAIRERFPSIDSVDLASPTLPPEGSTVLRAAGPGDVETLAELNLLLLEEERYDRSFTREELVARMSDLLARSYDAFFVVSGDEMAGYALVDRAAMPVYIRQFYIIPRYRRRGLGRAAVKDIVGAYRTRSIDVEVMAWNDTGAKFWAALGFTQRYSGLRLTLPKRSAGGEP